MDLKEKRKRIFDISNELEVLLNDQKIFKDLSTADTEIANYLHLLELDGLNSAQISKIVKGLRRALNNRRNIKGLYNLVNGVKSGISLSNYFKSVKSSLRPENEIKESIKRNYFDLLIETLDK